MQIDVVESLNTMAFVPNALSGQGSAQKIGLFVQTHHWQKPQRLNLVGKVLLNLHNHSMTMYDRVLTGQAGILCFS